ncbi:TIGR01777 family oxidoreductase [Hufsiella ginkgonis]|uniref:TIGR01777 family protein n=1 Tax=Hufsiella ginkgonis TaxID=2695274 RepID=A0A7K1Y1K0_9SPHI|nr:TIGR01777 family oxidoreductase [Hufsiella ginkgonis]MXV17101.1 TIGR01777 family protein [Hufsiella ginkgonis]
MKPYQKIVLAGGNGYLGGILAGYYCSLAEEVIVLSRKPASDQLNVKTLLWDGKSTGTWAACLENADLLVNLCGKNVNCRYTGKNKEEIFASRLLPTRLLGEEIGKMTNPPKLWINITSATIYRHAEDRPQDEYTGEIGHGFSVEVCKRWEQTFFDTKTPGTRKVALRMGIVLGRRHGAFPYWLNLAKFGLGGRQGNGKQYISWIHERDAARVTEWVLQHKELDGAINCTAPRAIRNAEMMKVIRDIYGASFGLPAPGWLLEIGALFLGTETELILKSRLVEPRRLLDSGYKFSYTEADEAVLNILTHAL